MTKSETVRLLTMIRTIFPQAKYISQDKNEFDLTVNCWYRLLADIDFYLLDIALQKHALTSTYPPAIADIRKTAIEIMTPKNEKIGAEEAWGEVVVAIRKYGIYQEQKALQILSPITKLIVEKCGWSNLCMSNNHIADRAHFLQMFASYQDRTRQQNLLPTALKKSIAAICAKNELKLIEGRKTA